MSNTKIILGFIAAASVGAIAGILLSPDKGSRTRQRIIDSASDFGNSVKDSITDFVKDRKDDLASARGKLKLNTMG